ncbi:sodium:solute symporter [Rufibacter glacialis]|uniref:Sodium:solute symporter n=1 Tax=Rufibacter glacialis TaxID=1259555 RepID=A0A5M8QSJ7_9BACT|nr:sodium:solute symporter [Rufibacter glacialis]KAA6437463.1 sodium:solute symporter [Rufibacter glacialis]GGK59153.1 solute:sodium symporter (SSS) family transporter [Rufibacter glacialis]
MSPLFTLGIIVSYFCLLLLVSFMTSKKGESTAGFFLANRASPWYIVAFGMIGTTLSGITFVSIPGMVEKTGFTYLQMVLGYVLGYVVIALVLLPLYYRLRLVSIYTYLEQRLGFWSYKTGSAFFLLSRTLSAALRLYLVAGVLQLAVFSPLGIPFAGTVGITIAFIWVYTFRGGMKTIIWTDTLQTLAMLLCLGISIWVVAEELDLSLLALPQILGDSSYAHIWVTDPKAPNFFLKQLMAGMFITIAMTGLDQDMMQKNLSCRNLSEAQKNMFWFTVILVAVNVLFLCLGALLYLYAAETGILLPTKGDDVFPELALQHFPAVAGVAFILGITAITYASADSALTSLTTAFCVDFLNFQHRPEAQRLRYKNWVHLGFSGLLMAVILLFRVYNDESIIATLFTLVGYTYGPLLGMYSFGLLTGRSVQDKVVPLLGVLSPVLTYVVSTNSVEWFWGYQFGFEVLLLNGLLMFLGLWLVSSRKPSTVPGVSPI